MWDFQRESETRWHQSEKAPKHHGLRALLYYHSASSAWFKPLSCQPCRKGKETRCHLCVSPRYSEEFCLERKKVKIKSTLWGSVPTQLQNREDSETWIYFFNFNWKNLFFLMTSWTWRPTNFCCAKMEKLDLSSFQLHANAQCLHPNRDQGRLYVQSISYIQSSFVTTAGMLCFWKINLLIPGYSETLPDAL